MRFRSRLLILVVAILLPAFIGAAIAVAYVYVEQQKDQERSVAETGHAFALLIDNEMRHQEGILRTLAASPALHAGDMAEFYAHARRAAEGVGAVAILYDLAGKTVLNTRRPPGAEVPGRDPSNLPALAQRFGAARTLVSDIFYAPRVARHDFMMQVPVAVDGKLRYHLLLGLHVGIIQQLLARQNFPDTWIATVVDRNGRIVARRASRPASSARWCARRPCAASARATRQPCSIPRRATASRCARWPARCRTRAGRS